MSQALGGPAREPSAGGQGRSPGLGVAACHLPARPRPVSSQREDSVTRRGAGTVRSRAQSPLKLALLALRPAARARLLRPRAACRRPGHSPHPHSPWQAGTHTHSAGPAWGRVSAPPSPGTGGTSAGRLGGRRGAERASWAAALRRAAGPRLPGSPPPAQTDRGLCFLPPSPGPALPRVLRPQGLRVSGGVRPD